MNECLCMASNGRRHVLKGAAAMVLAAALKPRGGIAAPALPSEVAGIPIPNTSLAGRATALARSEEHTSELQSPYDLVCRLLLEKKNKKNYNTIYNNKTKTKT